jgi:hypothetical protein
MYPYYQHRIISPNINGFYMTDYGPMTLTVEHNGRVYGNYTLKGKNVRGAINGTITGNVLTGHWHQTNYVDGELRFTFSPDGQSFQGLWSYNYATPSMPWNGKKVI